MQGARAARREMDILHGPIFSKIMAFVIPLMLTNMLQSLYNAADMIIVGLSGVEGALGAIGTTSAMVAMVINLFAGFAVGANIMVARAIGEGNRDKASDAVHTSVAVSIISSLITMTLGLFISRPLLAALGDQGHILELACLYTRIYFLGNPFIAATNFFISIFRAKGDTRTPLVVLTGTGVLNVILNLVFVLGFGMSVDGVSLATLISNLVSMLILGSLLHRDKGFCHFEIRKIRIEKYAFKGIIYNGLPAGVQGALFSLSNMLIQSSIIRINNITCPGGSDVIDGNAAGANIESFAYVTANSVTQAAVTFTSQHYGVKSTERMGKVLANCYLASFLVCEVVSIVILLSRSFLIGLYSLTPVAAGVAGTRLTVMLCAYFTLGAMDTGSGLVRGMNKSSISTIVSLLGSCVLRIIWIYTVVAAHPSLVLVYLSYPISWTITGLCHFIVAMSLKKKFVRLVGEPAAEPAA
ncbi:MAG: MATE family efflux transporter [Spirochaetales bacterium]|nr:MATE family efflux transporter [Spirochaetales bacterium]